MVTSAIIFFFILFFGGNYAIYKTVIYAFSITDITVLWWLKVIFIVLMISFPTLQMLAQQWFSPVTKFLYTVSAVWLGTLFWLCLAVIIFFATYGIAHYVALEINLLLIAKILIIGALAISAYGIFHSYQIKIKTTNLFLDDLPEFWENKRVVLFSDSHFGNIKGETFSKKLVRTINQQKPDIVLIAGDVFDGPPLDIQKVTDPFRSLSTAYGAYFAPGNHEEYGDEINFLKSLQEVGIHVLSDKKEVVEGLQIIGVNYSSTKTSDQQREVLNRLLVDKNQTSILIKHEPSHIEIAEEFTIDLQVSGHTHKGQIFPLSFLTKMTYGKFYYGLNVLENTQVYTTSGVGSWGPPQRIGTDAEIIVMKLKKSL